MSDPTQPPGDDPFAQRPPQQPNTPPPPGIPGDVPPPPPSYGQPPAYGQAPAVPPSYGAMPPASYGGAGYQQPQNGTGTAALVLGILGIVCCGIFTAIPAIFLGRKGMKLADQGLATNRGLAQAGFILGIIGVVLSVISLIFLAANGWQFNVGTTSNL
jgi:hypothetical protein